MFSSTLCILEPRHNPNFALCCLITCGFVNLFTFVQHDFPSMVAKKLENYVLPTLNVIITSYDLWMFRICSQHY
jgi:hypothetical protein